MSVAAALADPTAVAYLRKADPVMAAHGFLLVALDRPDVFLSNDLALRHAVQRAYGFDDLPTEAEMVQVAERWRPHRSLAVSYLFASAYGGQT